MTQYQKVIRAKVGVLELAKQLGNVSQACKMMGYSRDSFRWPLERRIQRPMYSITSSASTIQSVRT
jgi:hypothetical protein